MDLDQKIVWREAQLRALKSTYVALPKDRWFRRVLNLAGFVFFAFLIISMFK